MNLTSFWLVLFIGVICALPWLVKWVQRRTGKGLGAQENTSRLVSVLALGPQQRLMTVEVGTGDERIRLVLGVTAQSITCLHSQALAAVPAPPLPSPPASPDFADALRGRTGG